MSTILYVILALLLFGVIVFAHELGHFLSARACGIGVEEFALGFGPRLLGWRGRHCQYSLRLIPLGGYCKFYGEDEQSDREDAFNRQNVWKRILTVFSGPFMNFVLAYLAVVVYLMAVGAIFYAPLVADVTPGMGAAAAGMQAGDVVVEVEGQAIPFSEEGYGQMVARIQSCDPAQPIRMVVEREGERLDMQVSAQQVGDSYQIGILVGTVQYRYPLGQALGQSFVAIKNITQLMLDSLGKLFTTGEGMDQTTGPVGLISVMTESIQQGFSMVLNLIVVISLNLGLINLLPLPALDGGRLVFLLVEAVRRKPVKPEYEGWVHAAGFVLLMGLIVLITFRDIARLITG